MEQQFARAEVKHARVSARKAGRYAAAIKGMKYQQAYSTLEFMTSPTAKTVQKVLASAGANAEENHDMTRDQLYVYEAVANQGPTFRRFRPAMRGMATRIRKRTSHIIIVLSDKPRKS